MLQLATLATSTQYLAYYILEADECTEAALVPTGGASGSMGRWFDISAGTVGGTNGADAGDGTLDDSGMVEFLPGIWLCWIVFTTESVSAPTHVRCYLGNPDQSEDTSWTGDDDKGLYILHHQIEAGKWWTSPIRTTGATLTRSADVINASDTDWFNDDQGTFYFEVELQNLNGNHFVFELGPNSDRHFIYTSGSSFLYGIRVATVSQGNIGPSGGVINTPIKLAATYEAGNMIFATSFGTTATGTPASLPSAPTPFELAAQDPGSVELSGWMKKATYKPVVSTQAELEAMVA